jgi:hypothetical protein
MLHPLAQFIADQADAVTGLKLKDSFSIRLGFHSRLGGINERYP